MIATANLGEMLDAAALLAAQPVPAGPRVAVVSNTAAPRCSPPTRAATRACRSPLPDTQQMLRAILRPTPPWPGRSIPPCWSAPALRQCLELAGADPGVDAVLALTTASAGSDLVPEVAAARLPVPIAAAVLDQVEVVRLLRAPGADSPAVPAYAYAESAARALGHAARYGMWRAVPPGTIPDLDGLRRTGPGNWSPNFSPASPPRLAAAGSARGTARLLRHTAGRQHRGRHRGRRRRGGGKFGGPVALRADVPGLVRARVVGALLIDLHGVEEVRRGFRSLQETFGHRLAGVIVKPMVIGGVEVMISVLQERVAGPLVLFGPAARPPMRWPTARRGSPRSPT